MENTELVQLILTDHSGEEKTVNNDRLYFGVGKTPYAYVDDLKEADITYVQGDNGLYGHIESETELDKFLTYIREKDSGLFIESEESGIVQYNDGGVIDDDKFILDNMDVFGYQTKNFNRQAKAAFVTAIEKAKDAMDDSQKIYFAMCANIVDFLLFDPNNSSTFFVELFKGSNDTSKRPVKREEVYYILQKLGIYNYKSGMYLETYFLNDQLAERNMAQGGVLSLPIVDGHNLIVEMAEDPFDGFYGTICTQPQNYYVATIKNSDGDLSFEKMEANTREINHHLVAQLYKEGKIPIKPKPWYLKAENGAIINQYANIIPEELWKTWNRNQRLHFIQDHFINKEGFEEANSRTTRHKWIDSKYDDLPKFIQTEIAWHIQAGQYAAGGRVARYYTLQLGNMKKPQEFILYPYHGGDDIHLQSDKRWITANLRTGKGKLSPKNQNYPNRTSILFDAIEIELPADILTSIQEMLWFNTGEKQIQTGLIITDEELFSKDQKKPFKIKFEGNLKGKTGKKMTLTQTITETDKDAAIKKLKENFDNVKILSVK